MTDYEVFREKPTADHRRLIPSALAADGGFFSAGAIANNLNTIAGLLEQ